MIKEFDHEYIYGSKFKAVADFIFDDHLINYEGMEEGNGVIWCSFNRLLDLFRVLEKSKNRYILITHHDTPDTCILDEYLYHKKPECIVYWYSKNALINKLDVSCIPYGIENDSETVSVFLKLAQKEKGNNTWKYDENMPKKERIQHINHNLFIIFSNKEDCLGIWEALYADSIPVVVNMPVYEKLQVPVINMNSSEEIVPELLQDIRSFYSDKSMTMSYWMNEIIATRKKMI